MTRCFRVVDLRVSIFILVISSLSLCNSWSARRGNLSFYKPCHINTNALSHARSHVKRTAPNLRLALTLLVPPNRCHRAVAPAFTLSLAECRAFRCRTNYAIVSNRHDKIFISRITVSYVS
ncbi:hypothetical protein EDB85DRAFT_1965493 [Lactarius pseudohatsudake]|nr:hypothetical protein EDB85DRAFT_1965493 [Lactarius pseudohatsudake]